MNVRDTLYPGTSFQNIRDLVQNSAKQYGTNDAFIIKKKSGKITKYEHISYQRLEEEMNALGTAFIKLGLKGKRIAIIGKNRYEWALSYLATINGVGIVVPLDKGLPDTEIFSLLERSKSDAIVFESSYMEAIQKVKESHIVTEYICMDDIKQEGIKTIKELIEIGKQEVKNGNREYIDSIISNDTMATIIFTSGTTSLSKAVMLSHKNIASNINDMSLVEKMYDTDVNLAFLPFHHTFGSTGLLVFLASGATNVFCDGLRYIQENLKEYKVSVFVCVPLLLEKMYKKIMMEIEKQGKTKLVKIVIPISNFLLKLGIDIRRKLFKDIINNLGGNLRFIISGASAIDKKVAKGFNDFGILTVQGYGLTETSPVLTAENIKAIRYGSIGFPMHSVDIKIDNPNEDGIGEIIAKGPNIMLGYYENEEATQQVLKDGWFHTGDLGYIDKDGYVFITGRMKNVIVLKNGKNVYPEELEQLINNLPYVEESMVFGKPKEDDLVVSVKIVYNEEYMKQTYPEKAEKELQDIVWKDIKKINQGLTTYKWIKYLILTNEPMNKTTTAKVKRFEEMKEILKEN